MTHYLYIAKLTLTLLLICRYGTTWSSQASLIVEKLRPLGLTSIHHDATTQHSIEVPYTEKDLKERQKALWKQYKQQKKLLSQLNRESRYLNLQYQASPSPNPFHDPLEAAGRVLDIDPTTPAHMKRSACAQQLSYMKYSDIEKRCVDAIHTWAAPRLYALRYELLKTYTKGRLYRLQQLAVHLGAKPGNFGRHQLTIVSCPYWELTEKGVNAVSFRELVREYGADVILPFVAGVPLKKQEKVQQLWGHTPSSYLLFCLDPQEPGLSTVTNQTDAAPAVAPVPLDDTAYQLAHYGRLFEKKRADALQQSLRNIGLHDVLIPKLCEYDRSKHIINYFTFLNDCRTSQQSLRQNVALPQ